MKALPDIKAFTVFPGDDHRGGFIVVCRTNPDQVTEKVDKLGWFWRFEDARKECMRLAASPNLEVVAVRDGLRLL